MLTITMKNNGIVDPFGLYWLRDSKFQLMAGTRDNYEEIESADGVIDFGTVLATSEITLELINLGTLTQIEKNTLRNVVTTQLNELREYGILTWESDPLKQVAVRLNGKPTQYEIPGRFKISVPLLCQPFWQSVTEHSLTGHGTIINAGTFEAPIKVEILGPCTNPWVAIGDKVMTFTGVVSSSDILSVDTGALTATLNGVNALSYNGVFPNLVPGRNLVMVGQGNTTIKWFDCWI